MNIPNIPFLKPILQFFYGIMKAGHSIPKIETEVAQLVEEVHQLKRYATEHIENFHITVETKYLKIKHNILWNHKTDPPEACCLYCHDSKGKLIRLYIEKSARRNDVGVWDRFVCKNCNDTLAILQSDLDKNYKSPIQL